MNSRALFASIAFATAFAGGAAWWATRPARDAPPLDAPAITAGALWSAKFQDTRGQEHSLGEFQGQVVVVNFWATWCAPCREEMPGFARLQDRWKARGVRFIGLADDDPAKVQRFGEDLRINYPLWIGRETAGELSRRLGNRLGVLPHTVIIDPAGNVLDARVGPYSEADMDGKLSKIASKN